MTTRREFLAAGAAAGLAGALSSEALAAPLPPISPMGIASTAMSMHLGGAGGVTKALREDSVAYVEYCRSLGAGGVQFSPTGDLKKLRRRMDQLGMWFEGEARGLPTTLDGDTAAFEKNLLETKALGGTVVRTVSRPPEGTSGRRYEGFKSKAQFDEWQANANAIVLKCLPIAERVGVRLALENHKDRLVDEHVDFLKKTSSEYLGALVDPGNNLSMLQSPTEVCTKLAPYVMSCSMKDMGVAPYEDGFLMSEVLFDTGATDQAALWKILKAGNPKLNPLQELITRDPLKVPCLTPGYWASYPDRTALELVKHMEWVKANTTKLPYVSQLTPQERLQAEEDNNRKTLDWGRTHLS
jgi:sugar phosphate isomerase/epimerase